RGKALFRAAALGRARHRSAGRAQRLVAAMAPSAFVRPADIHAAPMVDRVVPMQQRLALAADEHVALDLAAPIRGAVVEEEVAGAGEAGCHRIVRAASDGALRASASCSPVKAVRICEAPLSNTT